MKNSETEPSKHLILHNETDIPTMLGKGDPKFINHLSEHLPPLLQHASPSDSPLRKQAGLDVRGPTP